MPKTTIKSSEKTREQKDADKEILEIINASYEATKWTNKKTKKDLQCEIAGVHRRIESTKDQITKVIDELQSMNKRCNGPENIHMSQAINDLNVLYWVWVGYRNALTILQRGY